MTRGFIVVAMLLAASSAFAAEDGGERQRLADAAQVVHELRSAPDNRIPDSIWERARCVAVLPGVKKAAFIIGGEFGKGVMSCRTSTGWSAPVFLTLDKASFGAQAGAQSTDVVLLVMNERGMEKFLQDRVTLGDGASIATGPVGRTGEAVTDGQLTAEILSYSHTQGLFAGIDLSGGMLRLDNLAEQRFYGHIVLTGDTLAGREHTPTEAYPFIEALKSGLRIDSHGTSQ